MTDAFLQTLLTAIPVTIAAVATAIVTVKQGNKASAKTDARVDEVKDAVSSNTSRLADVHNTVNGNFTIVSDKLEAAQRENVALREEIARHEGTQSTTSHPKSHKRPKGSS